MRHLWLLLLIPTLTWGQVQYLPKDTPAPYTGYLFTLEAEKANRKSLLDLDIYKQLDESNKRILDLRLQENKVLTEQYQLWKGQSDSLSKQLVSARNDTFWKSLVYFGLGCLVTTGLAFAVNKATK
jgi:hypothetical protein